MKVRAQIGMVLNLDKHRLHVEAPSRPVPPSLARPLAAREGGGEASDALEGAGK